MKLWYLATPYSKYPLGLDEAFDMACRQTALLVQHRIPVFCPIAHTHPVAKISGMDPHDHTIWLPCDEPLMHACTGLIMVKAISWELSYGMNEERKTFEKAGKPVVWMTPGEIPQELLDA